MSHEILARKAELKSLSEQHAVFVVELQYVIPVRGMKKSWDRLFFATLFFFFHESELVFPCKYSSIKHYTEGNGPELIYSHYSAQV